MRRGDKHTSGVGGGWVRRRDGDGGGVRRESGHMTRRPASALHISAQPCNHPDSAECFCSLCHPLPTSPTSTRRSLSAPETACQWRRLLAMETSISQAVVVFVGEALSCLAARVFICVLVSVSLSPATLCCARAGARAWAASVCLVGFPVMKRIHVLRHSAVLPVMQRPPPPACSSFPLHRLLLRARGCAFLPVV